MKRNIKCLAARLTSYSMIFALIFMMVLPQNVMAAPKEKYDLQGLENEKWVQSIVKGCKAGDDVDFRIVVTGYAEGRTSIEIRLDYRQNSVEGFDKAHDFYIEIGDIKKEVKVTGYKEVDAGSKIQYIIDWSEVTGLGSNFNIHFKGKLSANSGDWTGNLQVRNETGDETINIKRPGSPEDELIPSISLTKEALVDSVKVGHTITYTYKITNNGDVDLTNITLTDDKITDPISLPSTTLAAGATMTATATVTATEAGTLVNEATATGKDGDTSVSASATASVTVEPQDPVDPWKGTIQIIKTVRDANEVPRLLIEETPNPLSPQGFVFTLTGEGYSDTKTTDEYGFASFDNLSAGDYTLTEASRKGYTSGISEEGMTIALNEDTVGEDNIKVVEIANLYDPEEPGDPWLGIIIVIKNVEDATAVYRLSMEETPDHLSPREFVFTLTGDDYEETVATDEYGEASFGPLPAGNYILTETPREDYTSSIPKTGRTITLNSEDTEETDGVFMAYVTNTYKPDKPDPEDPELKPSISLEKTVSSTRVKVGNKVTYTYVIKNTGDYVLNLVTLKDDKLGELISVSDVVYLDLGEDYVITKSYTTKSADVGTLTNIATATGMATVEESVYEKVEAKDRVSITVYKDSPDKPDKPDRPDKPEKPEPPEVPVEVPEEPIPEGPPATEPEPPEVVEVPEEPVPEAPPAKELPKTGGNPIVMLLSGLTLAGVGLFVRRKD